MKAQFKYAFRAGLSPRIIVFAIILVMNLAFIVTGLLGILPLAAHITAVSLSSAAIAVMVAFNIVGDVSIIRCMIGTRNAVPYALTPAPRRNTLIASVVAMTVMDFITTAVSILSVLILSFNLAGYYVDESMWATTSSYGTLGLQNILLPIALIIAGYLFIMMFIILCATVRKSVFFSIRAGGFLTFLVAIGTFYTFTVLSLLLAPFGEVTRQLAFFTVTVGYLGMGMYALLMFIVAAVLFILTSRLMEKKLNI